MAENKKSFLLYCDIITTVKKLPKNKIADLFLTILEYVNDLNPEVKDRMVDLVFEPIKLQLKRDLIKYENMKVRNSVNGAKGGRPLKPKEPTGLNENPLKAKKAVTVTDTVTDTDTVKDIKKERKRFAPPARQEVWYYLQEKGMKSGAADTQAGKFIDHYQSNGWLVGKNKMKDWRAAVRSNWLTDTFSTNGQSNYSYDEVVRIHNDSRDKRTQKDFEIEKPGIWKLKA